jgi:HEAT repeat protein
MIKKTMVVLFGAALVLFAGSAGWTQEPAADPSQTSIEAQAKTLYEAAKKSIYEKNYTDAIAKLKALTSQDAESPFGQEGLYWLGYSLDKLAATLNNINQSLEMKEDAIARLDTLLKNFPKNSWANDARILQVQIAEALVKSGLGNYRRYINRGVSGGVAGGIEGGVEGGVSGGVQGGITDQEFDLKLVALDALLGMDAESAFPILEKMIRKDNRPELREKALFILSQGNKAKVGPILADIARKDPDPEMRKKALFWLGQTGAAESAQILKEIVQSTSESNDVKEQAVFGISQLPKAEAVPMLVDLAKSKANIEIREKALFWLGQSGAPEAAKILKDIVLSSTEPENLREQAVFGISQLPKVQAVPVLIELSKSGTNVGVREKALFWLGQSGSPEAAKILKDITLSSTESDDLKENAVFGISQLPKDQAVPMLIEIAKSSAGRSVREKAIFWLGQSKSPEAMKFLRDLIEK